MADKKEEKDKLADTNMEMYASPLADKVRKAAADTEKAWKGAGADVGIEIWRIENFGVKRWPKDRYGDFFQGDSYIVLETYKPDPKSENLDYNVYFWLGKDTTQDEYGTAAYKTVELDTYLGGEPVQSREVQGFESDEWDQVFPDMNIMKGGAKSAFNKVKPTEWPVKLFIVQGKNKKSVKINEVPMKVESLANADAYVLDAGLEAFTFFGNKASVWEKMKANQRVDKLQGQRGKCEDGHVDGLEDDTDDSKRFWELMGGKPDSIPDTHPKFDFDRDEEKEDKGFKLYQLSDNKGGKVNMKELDTLELNDKGKIVSKDVLNSKDVMMIDTGMVCYVWAGMGASKNEREFAMPVILEDKTYARRPFRKCCEGKESKCFKKLFAKW